MKITGKIMDKLHESAVKDAQESNYPAFNDQMNFLIEDEEEAIQGYTNALSNLKGSMTEEQYSEIEKVLNHIIEEEKEHIKEINELAVKIAKTRE